MVYDFDFTLGYRQTWEATKTQEKIIDNFKKFIWFNGDIRSFKIFINNLFKFFRFLAPDQQS